MRRYEDHKSPTTKAQYREQIITYMIESGRNARRYLDAGKEVPHNPEGLPEMSLSQGKHMPARKWQVAQDMVCEGVARITNGSFESGSVYIVAGDNWV